MSKLRPIHPDFLFLLEMKDRKLVELFKDIRSFVFELYPDSNELLYHTHALTSVISLSDKPSDGFCMIPMYTNHLNLGFHKGTLIRDPHKLLQGTGNLIRHIPISSPFDYRNKKVIDLVKGAAEYALKDLDVPGKVKGMTISKLNVSR